MLGGWGLGTGRREQIRNLGDDLLVDVQVFARKKQDITEAAWILETNNDDYCLGKMGWRNLFTGLWWLCLWVYRSLC